MSDDAIPMKPFGRHDVSISALGFGGHHLGDAPDISTAIRIVQEAVDSGITFFDNCWEYHRGKTEDWMGQGLKGRRDKVFLMTKVCTHGREGRLATEMLEQSLRRLQTDHLDLWQIHGVGWDNDPDLFIRPNGAAEALRKAKEQGKIRFTGFTGHKDPAVHLKMIETGFPFDAVQMPLNPFDAHFLSFAEMILPECSRRGMAALGMKPLSGHGEPITNGELTVEEALRYAMSLPVATTITGIDKLEVLRQNVKIARGFKPMTPEEMKAIRDRVKQAAGDGRYEIYKVSLRFDNPEARLAHGFPLDDQSVEVKEMMKATENTGFPFPDVKQQQAMKRDRTAQMADDKGYTRRSFVKKSAVGLTASIVARSAFAGEGERGDPPNDEQVPHRPLGKTGVQVSALGVGGYHLGSIKDQNESNELVARSLAAGINFFDSAWEYHDGVSEERLGNALKGKRDSAFLMTKVCTHGRTKDIAMKQLEESLRRLKTDHLDLWQIHEVVYYNDPDMIFAPNGAAEALLEAKKQGKVRFIGFTGHKNPAIHMKMLSHDFPFDTVQMPLNALDATFKSFEQQVVPEAIKRGIAILGMKSMGGSGEIVSNGALTAEDALRYAMSLPVATTISGMDSLGVLEQNLRIARGFKALSENAMQTLRENAKVFAADGRYELFKTTTKYDGKIGREQHHYPPIDKLPA